MIGWTIGRYFFWRYVAITFWFFTGIFIIAYLIDFTEISSRTASLPLYTMQGAMLMAAFHIPIVMQQLVPFIALFSGMATLISLNRRHELVVARASGISAWQFLTPVCLGALLFGVLSVTVLNPVAAFGFQKAAEIEAMWREGNSNVTVGDQVPWLRQRTEDGDTIIGAKSVLAQGRILSDVVLIHFNEDGEIVLRQDARRATLGDGYWLITDVRESGGNQAARQLKSAKVKTNLRRELVEQKLVDPQSVSFFQLNSKIETARAFGFAALAMRMQKQSLIALPALLIAMTLIAATVSLRFARFGQSGTMILGGILAGFLLYVISVLVTAFGSTGFVPPVIAAWFPVVVASFIGITFLLHKEDG